MPCRRLGVLALSLLFLGGCAGNKTRLYVLDAQVTAERPATYAGLPLQDGQVVLSEAPGPYSFMFSLAPVRHFNFTHGAILSIEEGLPYVYDMTGEYKVGFDETPTDGIEGYCRRLPLLEYCLSNLYVEIHDPPPGVDGAAVAAWARARHAEQVAFDPYFVWEDHEALFCTEFVQLALEAGGAPPRELEPVRQHPSLQRLLTWAKVGRERNLPAGVFADSDRYRAALGQLPSRAAAYAYFAAKRELHRRFTADQLLGNVFQLEGMADITLRPEIRVFLQRAVTLFPASAKLPPEAEVQARVAAVAEELFGSRAPEPGDAPEAPEAPGEGGGQGPDPGAEPQAGG